MIIKSKSNIKNLSHTNCKNTKCQARIQNARQEYKMPDIKSQLFSNTSIYDALHHLVSFVQFKKREKHSLRSVTFTATSLKVSFYGCFPRFLNCTNGTKLRKTSQIKNH